MANAPKQLSTEAWQVAVNTRHLQTTAVTTRALSRLCRWPLLKGPVRRLATSGVKGQLWRKPQTSPATETPRGIFPASLGLSKDRIGVKHDAEASSNRKLKPAQY